MSCGMRPNQFTFVDVCFSRGLFPKLLEGLSEKARPQEVPLPSAPGPKLEGGRRFQEPLCGQPSAEPFLNLRVQAGWGTAEEHNVVGTTRSMAGMRSQQRDWDFRGPPGRLVTTGHP